MVDAAGRVEKFRKRLAKKEELKKTKIESKGQKSKS
jgi:ribosomal protein L31